MATSSNFALRVPPSLMDEVKALAAQDATSINQFMVTAVAEKVAVLRSRGYLANRAARAAPGDLARILAKAGTPTPIEGDELPDDWNEAAAS